MTAFSNAGMPWTQERIDALMNDFTAGATLRELCERHGRTPAGILSKLEQCGLLVQIGKNYYKVDPDPWTNYVIANELHKELRK